MLPFLDDLFYIVKMVAAGYSETLVGYVKTSYLQVI
jgi:hypothetical protein